MTAYKESSIKIGLMMADGDVVCRVAKLFMVPHKGPYKSQDNRKDRWACTIYGTHAAEWMMTLYSLMGIRRKHQINEALTRWKKQRVLVRNRWREPHSS